LPLLAKDPGLKPFEIIGLIQGAEEDAEKVDISS
jgi:hypothetical protein